MDLRCIKELTLLFFACSLIVQDLNKKATDATLASKAEDGSSGPESRLLYELGFYLSNCGLSEPLHQVITL